MTERGNRFEELRRGIVSHGQWGQDFWVFAEAFNGMQGGYFLDIGAHDGVSISNTYTLEKDFDWTGLLIEANPQSFEKLARARKSKALNICLDQFEGEVEFALRGALGGIIDLDLDNKAMPEAEQTLRMRTRPLKDVLDAEGVPEVIDFLSIDIEGSEDRVLLDFDFNRYRFNCITVERPSKALRKHLIAQQYQLVRDLPGMDSFFVHQSFLPKYCKNLREFYSGTTKHRARQAEERSAHAL